MVVGELGRFPIEVKLKMINLLKNILKIKQHFIQINVVFVQGFLALYGKKISTVYNCIFNLNFKWIKRWSLNS